ncbi:MAG: NAD-binding protein [Rhodocyclaceae bacterium]
MSDTLMLILRRMRRPLIVIITVLSISVFGLAHMPGMDAHGNPATLGYFHALYIVSYTATTIGYGEVPYPFSEAQRAWVIFSIYLSVTTWAYAVGSILHMMRDPAFRAAMARNQFNSRVRRLEEPFILIVGYGQSGMLLARMLDRIGWRTVIVEVRPERAGRADLEEYVRAPIVLAADGRLPEVLVNAGVTSRMCQVMVVLSGNDETVQSVAVSGTILNPGLRIIARVTAPIATENLDPFPRIETVNAFESFASNIGLDLGSPEKLRIEEWLTGLPGSARPDILGLPMGHWIICGFGRFGYYASLALEKAGATWTAIDDNPAIKDHPNLLRRTYSREALHEAGIDRAVGLLVGTDQDPINLAAVNRARQINPKLFIAIRQTHAMNASLIEAARADVRFIQADVISHEVRQLITSPLLNRFLTAVRADTGDLVERTGAALEAAAGDSVPFLWVLSCMTSYPGLREALSPDADPPLTIADFLTHPNNASQLLSATPLLMLRGREQIFLPSPETVLKAGDKLLFAGSWDAEQLQRQYLYSPSPPQAMRKGIEPPRSWLFRQLAKRRARTLATNEKRVRPI